MPSLMRAAAALSAAGVVAVACGARTGLVSPPLRSNAFCVTSSYDAGFTDLDLYFLLDRSESMQDGDKWTSAAAALDAFVSNSAEDGLGVSVAFFPPLAGDVCSPDTYAQPAVPIGLLPGAAGAVKNALASAQPDYGTTPLAEALRGGVEYARGVRLADPTRDVAIAVITDGAPEGCGEPATEQAVHDVDVIASQAFGGEPSIMTFIIGLSIGYVPPMNEMAAAGGTKQAILIDASPNTAQNIVDALGDVRDTLRKCRFPIPPVGDAQVAPGDLSVSYELSPTSGARAITLHANASDCGNDDGFIVDDPSAPTRIELCPASCAAVHTSTTAKVTVTAGCGVGSPDGGARDGGGDAGACPEPVPILCYPSCSNQAYVAPACEFGEWTCPPGSVDATACECPAVPHGCCLGDGTYAPASCVDANWTCPPGSTFFGGAGCAPPAACAPLLPCGPGQLCSYPDHGCGSTNVLGACASEPNGCTPDVKVCGCDGVVYSSACAAESGGVDLGDSSSCATPSGTFGCGPYFCRSSDQICKKTIDLVKTVAATSWACISDAGCPTGCGCNECQPCPAGHSKCDEACTTDGSGDRFLTCSELP